MMRVLPRVDSEFKTLDGLTLRGWVFPTSQGGPAMIMSPGVRTRATSCLTDLWVVQYAQGCHVT